MLRFVICLSAVAAANADEVFSQGPPEALADVGFGFFSHAEPTPAHNFKHADNFVIEAGAEIGGVRWWGISEGLTSPDIPNVSGFLVEIYAADSLIPGDLLYETTFDLDQTDPTMTGRFNNGVNEYVHEVTLPESFVAAPDTEYFLAVAAIPVDPAADGWLWEDADMDQALDLHYATYGWAQEAWSAGEGYDSAFELIAVPAPAGGVVLAAGGVGLMRRRTR